ncbi:hypothetical protein ACQPT2_13875 [Erwinia amylovora]
MDTTLLRALDSKGKEQFESAINAFQGDVSVAAARLSIDPHLRLEYSKRIKEMASDLRARANSGVISWQKAAMEAQETRNLIMEMVRTRSTPLGRAMAERLKASETGRQVAINGAGIAGGWAGGALAGLMCGPGAPVCVLLGGFVGGALAAWEMGNWLK